MNKENGMRALELLVEGVFKELKEAIGDFPIGEFHLGKRFLWNYSQRVDFKNEHMYILAAISEDYFKLEIRDEDLAKKVQAIIRPDYEYGIRNAGSRVWVRRDVLATYQDKTNDPRKIAEILPLLWEDIELLKKDLREFVREYKHSEALLECEVRAKYGGETPTRDARKVSKRYDGVWYPIKSDKELRAVLRKIVLS